MLDVYFVIDIAIGQEEKVGPILSDDLLLCPIGLTIV